MLHKGLSKTGILFIILGLLWMGSDFFVVRVEDFGWLLKYWPVLLVIAGVNLALLGSKAKNVSALLLIIALLVATLHHGMQFYDVDWNEYDYENDWDVFL